MADCGLPMQIRRIVAMTMLLALSGCASAPPRLLRPPRMGAIAYRFHAPSSQLEERITISRLGELYATSSERGSAEGQLSDEQIDALLKVMTGWERLKETYAAPPNGPYYVFSYQGRAVTGGSLGNAPPPFQLAVLSLQRLAEGMKWRK